MTSAVAQGANVRRNILANYAGGFWSALMGFAFVPLYIRYIGIESYGLIGIYASMQVWFALLDMGISHALSREMARYTAGAHTPQSIRVLFHSLELIYFGIAVLLATAFALAAPWIATKWLQVEALPVATVESTLVLIGCVVALRWIGALYRGALIGLQRQVWLSTCNAAFATLRSGAVVLVLAWVSPSVEAFFAYQGVVGVLELLVLAVVSRNLLPSAAGARRFSFDALQQVWRFAGGMALITVLSILLTQVDKLILSKLLPLSQFGYYTLAYTAASALHLMTTPIGNAAYPRLTQLATDGNVPAVASAYHAFSQILTVILVPIATVMMVFSEYVLLLWTHSTAVTAATATLFSMLLIGNTLNGLMHLPYNLQLAHGWTRFTIAVNTVALVVLVPLIYLGVIRFGAPAAAAAWILLNASYLVVAVPLMHRRLLPAEKWRWYWYDVLAPAAPAVLAVLLVRAIAGPADAGEPVRMVVTLAAAAALSFASAALAVPRVRNELRNRLRAS